MCIDKSVVEAMRSSSHKLSAIHCALFRPDFGYVQGWKTTKLDGFCGPARCSYDTNVGDVIEVIGNLVKGVGLFKMWHISMMHEAGVNNVLDLVEHVLPISIQIKNDDWFLVQTKLSPGGDFHCLI